MQTLSELRKTPHISHSAISTYMNCPMLFAFRYHFKIKPETGDSIPLIFGSSIHAAAAQMFIAKQNGDCMPLEEVKEAFKSEWNLACKAANKLTFNDNEEAGKLEKQGMDLMECLYCNFEDEEIVAVEKPFQVMIPGISKVFIGAFDLVLKINGKIVIVDLKTSKMRWSKKKADQSLQATAYAYAWYKHTGVIPEVRFAVLVKNKKPVYETHSTFRDEQSFKRYIKLLQAIQHATAESIWYPNDQSFFCGSCAYKNACKQWGCSFFNAA
jgi:CRISPR/Cas system-associated exonuclease Cas4 (RecB family)